MKIEVIKTVTQEFSNDAQKLFGKRSGVGYESIMRRVSKKLLSNTFCFTKEEDQPSAITPILFS